MDPLVLTEIYEASVEAIWKALTDKDEMKKWYFDLDEFKPEVGFEFSFEGQGETGRKYIHHCKILEVIPFEKLKYSWEYEGMSGYSEVTFELSEVSNGTQLTLTHSGVESFPFDKTDFKVGSFKKGWTALLTEYLKNYLKE